MTLVSSVQVSIFSALLCMIGLAATQNSSKYDHLEHAAQLISQGQLARAEAILAAMLRESSDEANALNLLGVIRAQQQRDDEVQGRLVH